MTHFDVMHSNTTYKGPKEGIYTRLVLETCVTDANVHSGLLTDNCSTTAMKMKETNFKFLSQ